MSEKSMQSFVDATRYPYQHAQQEGMKYLHQQDQGLEALARVYRDYEKETGKILVNESNGVYEKLNHLAEKFSKTDGKEISTPANIKSATYALTKSDGSIQENQIEDILSGKTSVRQDLVRSVGEILNKENPAADKMLDRLSEIHPELGKRIGEMRNINDQTEQGKALVGFINEVMKGQHDNFQTSQAAYNFRQLADMNPSDPKFDEAFGKATNNYPQVGNYLAIYKGAKLTDEVGKALFKDALARQMASGIELDLNAPARKVLDNLQQHQQQSLELQH